MNNLPEFVTDEETPPRPQSPLAHVTGWETVVFELDDDLWNVDPSDYRRPPPSTIASPGSSTPLRPRTTASVIVSPRRAALRFAASPARSSAAL